MTKLRFLGLDVHAETIAVAIAEPGGEVRSIGTIPNRLESIRKMIGKLGPVKELRACYEAGPTGYVLYWQLTTLGVDCQVVAPTLIPVKAGDRVKTDRRDAEKLARCHRAGDLTAVWVPDAAHEALRDLVRAREAGKKDQLRARHRLGKFLLRHGCRHPKGMTAWTKKHLEWVKSHVHFDQPALEAALQDYFHEVEHAAVRIERLEKSLDEAISKAPEQIRAVIEALQALRGVAQLTAATIVSEIGSFSRFEPRKLMGYSGLVASEHSSGNRLKRGAITRSGNAHLRRVVVEAAWSYQRRPWIGGYLLSDIPAAEVYQLHREPPNWKWQDDPEGFAYEVIAPADTSGVPALVFSLSATINDERIHAVIPGARIWKVTVPNPNNDFLKSWRQAALFRATMRSLLDRIKAEHGEQSTLHVFPAMPVALAVDFGRVIMPKADLKMILYDQNQALGGFVRALEIQQSS